MSNDKNNVYQLRTGRALFTPIVREEVSNGLAPYTDKPAEAAQRVEEVLCTVIVSFVRSFAERLATRAGQKIGEKVANIR